MTCAYLIHVYVHEPMDPGFLAVESCITVSGLAVCIEFHVAGRATWNSHSGSQKFPPHLL